MVVWRCSGAITPVAYLCYTHERTRARAREGGLGVQRIKSLNCTPLIDGWGTEPGAHMSGSSDAWIFVG